MSCGQVRGIHTATRNEPSRALELKHVNELMVGKALLFTRVK